MIVLDYIGNVSRRFQTFVGNRLSVIHDTTSPDQWRQVDTLSNPADIASRGIDASDTASLSTWMYGPQFLWQDTSHWPKQPRPHEVNEDDVEVKKEIAIHHTTSDTIDNIIGYHSDWRKLTRTIAWLIRFKTHCIHRYLDHQVQCTTGDLTLTELQTATNEILVYVQNGYFADEITNLKTSAPVKKDSRIVSLNPVLDKEMIRAKGRVNLIQSYYRIDTT